MKNTCLVSIKHHERYYLIFTFQGILTAKEATKAITEWKKLFEEKKNEKFTLIFHALEMTDYEPLARTSWQKTIVELSGQIENIWVVTTSKLIMAGAKIMSMFTSFSIKTVSTEDKVYQYYAEQAA
ncbi:hypothetical protein PZB74_08595 [Porifericola rhodea]|uniref:STAS/SEC14 domain-containing protein n=1 Tax=Porifericola rhodea TaxID=930972 RepID=UPI002664F518|nr:STAS/SEC14 domain-containing protein [Porifericola rhodea]WKN33391.1 hypothetical protein PZB74_08595 [Porifericola rhodea]